MSKFENEEVIEKQSKKQNPNAWIDGKKEASAGDVAGKNKIGLLEEFTQNATVHGLKHTYESGRSARRRGVWLLAFFGMLAVLLYTVITQLVLLMAYPTISKQSVEFMPSMPFPAVTLCNLNQIRNSQVHDEVSRQLLMAMSDMASIPSMNDSFLASQTSISTGELKSHIGIIAHPLNLTLLNCKWNNQPYPCQDIFTSRITDFGYCYTFNGRMDSSSVQRTAEHSGTKYGLTVVVNVMHDEYILGPYSDAVGMRVVLHDFHETPLVEGHGFDVAPGFSTKGSLRMTHKQYLPPPYKAFSGAECANTSTGQFNNFLKMYEHYDIAACVSECRYDYIVDYCGCQGLYDLGNATVCDPKDLLYCYKPRFGGVLDAATLEEKQKQSQNFTRGNLHNKCNCPMPCEWNLYDATISIASYPSKPLMDQDNTNTNLSLDEHKLRSNYLKLTLAYDVFALETVEQLPQYTFASIMSAFGGQLGIYVGASLLSLLEFLELGLDALYLKVSKIKISGRSDKPSK